MIDHEKYANELLSSLADDYPETESLKFVPESNKSGNAADAMEAIVCHRLFQNSRIQPTRIENTTHGWNDGIFNSRNLTNREKFFTNLRRTVADQLHDVGISKPVAYLMASSNPSEAGMRVWVIPEPIVHESLSILRPKQDGQTYVFEIFPEEQTIRHFDASPDLSPFSDVLRLSPQELGVLNAARVADKLAKLAHV